MAELTVADVVAKVLEEEGVEWYAGVFGGHITHVLDTIAKTNVKMYHMRHEQSGVYMADGWARATGKPGVALCSAGPGMANAISAMYHAYHARSPIVCLLAQHSTAIDGWSAWQEACRG